jgi:hypothetical protein
VAIIADEVSFWRRDDSALPDLRGARRVCDPAWRRLLVAIRHHRPVEAHAGRLFVSVDVKTQAPLLRAVRRGSWGRRRRPGWRGTRSSGALGDVRREHSRASHSALPRAGYAVVIHVGKRRLA